jgi:hypothetical protein
MKKVICLLAFLLAGFPVFCESVMMVFPQEEDTVVLFDDHSWYYHSEISWYDSVEFVHYDEETQFAILEEKSYLSKEGQIIAKGIAMNTSREAKGCEISYDVLDSDRNLIATGKTWTKEAVDPGNLFPFTIEFENVKNAKYISFEHIMEVK